MNKNNWLVWIVILVLILIQLIFSLSAIGQLRNEELIESVRSPWWFQNHLVTDGGYANLGWYAILTLTYNIFGFWLYTAKFVKLVIIFLGLIALSQILKKYLPANFFWLPLLFIGLSPTLLFFNTLQISHGIEIYLFFISLYFLDNLSFRNTILLGATAMLTWLTYPSFIYYFPILGFIYWYKKNFSFKNIVILAVSFLIPLIILVSYIQDRELLLFDRSFQRGLFRSNGGLELSLPLFMSNLNILRQDLFVSYSSYYYENPKVEFADFYPIFAVVFILGFGLMIAVKDKKYRLWVSLTLGLMIFYLILLNLVGPIGLGGVRRATSILFLFYALTTLELHFVLKHKKLSKYLRNGLYVSIGLILIHHLQSYPANLAHLKVPSPYVNTPFFKDGENYLDQIQKQDLYLSCRDLKNNYVNCGGYSLISASIEGACYWNKLICHKLFVFDTKQQKFLPITFNFWEGNNWER